MFRVDCFEFVNWRILWSYDVNGPSFHGEGVKNQTKIENMRNL